MGFFAVTERTTLVTWFDCGFCPRRHTSRKAAERCKHRPSYVMTQANRGTTMERAARNLRMVELRALGWSYRRIGQHLGLSGGRVRDIVAREHRRRQREEAHWRKLCWVLESIAQPPEVG